MTTLTYFVVRHIGSGYYASGMNGHFRPLSNTDLMLMKTMTIAKKTVKSSIKKWENNKADAITWTKWYGCQEGVDDEYNHWSDIAKFYENNEPDFEIEEITITLRG